MTKQPKATLKISRLTGTKIFKFQVAFLGTKSLVNFCTLQEAVLFAYKEAGDPRKVALDL